MVRGLAEPVTHNSCFFFFFLNLKCKLSVSYSSISFNARCAAQGGVAAVGQSFGEANQSIVALVDTASRSHSVAMVVQLDSDWPNPSSEDEEAANH